MAASVAAVSAQVLRERLRGALWALFIGDALAMPAHWYYNRSQVRAPRSVAPLR